MAGGKDRISDLPDDLIRRVLHFAPAREAAATVALSRRWRGSLSRSSGAVNLEALLSLERDAFVTAAGKALELADGPVTRLTIRVVGCNYNDVASFLHPRWDSSSEGIDVVADLLAHPAACRVEELRINAVNSMIGPMSFEKRHASAERLPWGGIYPLRIAHLPSETLRVVELTNCYVCELTGGAVAFPRMESLRLRNSTMPIDDLQVVIDAAPSLAAVHLECVFLSSRNTYGIYGYHKPPPGEVVKRFLRCPAATSLVLDRCKWTDTNRFPVEIYAPRLRRFSYTGDYLDFSLSPPAPDLARVDLQFLPGAFGWPPRDDDVPPKFWRLVRNFTGVRELKLDVPHLEDIAVASEALRAEILPVLRNLEHLEVNGVHRPKGKTAAVAIANLLRCSPALRDLRLNLSNAWCNACFRRQTNSLETKYQSDLEDSMNRFRRRHRSSNLTTTCLEHDDGGNYGEVSDLAALSGRRSFECMRSSLRRVSLQFRHQKTNCFGVKLIKFFAENAMVMEELCIDGGTEKLEDHINHKVERWVANSRERRMINSATSTDFVVLPLKRGNPREIRKIILIPICDS